MCPINIFERIRNYPFFAFAIIVAYQHQTTKYVACNLLRTRKPSDPMWVGPHVALAGMQTCTNTTKNQFDQGNEEKNSFSGKDESKSKLGHLLSLTVHFCVYNLILTLIQSHRLMLGIYWTINWYQKHYSRNSLQWDVSNKTLECLSPGIAQNVERWATSPFFTSLPFCHRLILKLWNLKDSLPY